MRAGSANPASDEGQPEMTLELGALLDKHPFMKESVGGKMVYSEHLAEIEAALPAEIVARAQVRGQARDLQETAAEIMAELEGMELDAFAATVKKATKYNGHRRKTRPPNYPPHNL